MALILAAPLLTVARLMLSKGVRQASKKYGPKFHKGMLWVRNVPNFEWILWHTGNTDESTMGCLILGSSQTENITAKDGFVGASVKAYKRVYPPIAAALEGGEKVTVTYIDYDYVEGKPVNHCIILPSMKKVRN